MTNDSDVIKHTASDEAELNLPGDGADQQQDVENDAGEASGAENSGRPGEENFPEAPGEGKDIHKDNFEDEAKEEEGEEGTKSRSAGKKKKEDRKLNPKFKDVRETGRWGEMGKNEIIIAAVVTVLVVIGVIIAVVVTASGETQVPAEVHVSPPTEVPTSSPTNPPVAPDVLIGTVVQAAENSSSATAIADPSFLPRDASFYDGLADQESRPAHQRAMSWLLATPYNSYEKDDMEAFVARFALASIYYQLGGPSWISADKWLTSESVCSWSGVDCEIGSDAISDLDLDRKNLNGTIPNEIALLRDVKKIWMSNNNLQGTIPGEVFGELPNLSVLYLNGNRLEGIVPTSLNPNQKLNTLYVQQNNLSGRWPFCPTFPGSPKIIQNFGMDCLEDGVGIFCQIGCCDDYACY